MNIKDFAIILHNRYEGSELTKEEERLAKELSFVVVFGYSDDNMELRGAIHDEFGCFDGGEAYITKDGLLEECGCECGHYEEAKSKAHIIEAIWCNGDSEYTWTYETKIPHETFDILDEEDNKWCRGIVFDINSLEG